MLGDVSLYYNPTSEAVNKQMDEMAVSLGYKFVFSNLLLTSKTNWTDAKKGIDTFIQSCRARDGSLPIPSTLHVKGVADIATSLSLLSVAKATPKGEQKLRILSRVTVALQHSDRVDAVYESLVSHVWNQSGVDCVAVRPANESQLMDLIANRDRFRFDLLSVDVSNGNFFQQIGIVSKSIKSGSGDVLIELELAQSNRGPNELSNVITQSRLVLQRMTGVVISSGSKSAFEMRSPLDLRNWARVFGFRSVDKNSGILLQRVVTRVLMRNAVVVSAN